MPDVSTDAAVVGTLVEDRDEAILAELRHNGVLGS
jgi:hypothetical protein